MKIFILLTPLLYLPCFAMTGNLSLQAQVADTCTIVADDINFGVVTLLKESPQKINTTGRIKTTCTKDTQYSIKLGTGNAGNYSRSMSYGDERLHYQLFSRRNPQAIWGDGTSGTFNVVNVASGIEEVEIIDAQLPLDQIAKPGTYQDSIIVIIDY